MAASSDSTSISISTSTADTMLQQKQHLHHLRTALTNFAHNSSQTPFQILSSIPPIVSSTSSQSPPHPAPTSPVKAQKLYILDSSFNPPTRAHLRLAVSALLDNDEDGGRKKKEKKRLLLLLATQNADKPSVPAPLEHRLAMMEILGTEVRRVWKEERGKLSQGRLQKEKDEEDEEEEIPGVDIGVTKFPYFIDKSRAIEESGFYTAASSGSDSETGTEREKNEQDTRTESETEQTHIIGYDTLIRLLNTKYYPPSHTLSPLTPLFQHHKLRVTYRLDPSTPREEQEAYIEKLRKGEREQEGAKREWAGRIRMVEPEAEAVGVSSTGVRAAIKNVGLDGGDWEGGDLGKWLTPGVREWVRAWGLYREKHRMKGKI